MDGVGRRWNLEERKRGVGGGGGDGDVGSVAAAAPAFTSLLALATALHCTALLSFQLLYQVLTQAATLL